MVAAGARARWRRAHYSTHARPLQHDNDLQRQTTPPQQQHRRAQQQQRRRHQVFFSLRNPLLRWRLPLLQKLLYNYGTMSYFCTVSDDLFNCLLYMGIYI